MRHQPSAIVKQVPVQHDDPSNSLIVGRGLVRSGDEGHGGREIGQHGRQRPSSDGDFILPLLEGVEVDVDGGRPFIYPSYIDPISILYHILYAIYYNYTLSSSISALVNLLLPGQRAFQFQYLQISVCTVLYRTHSAQYMPTQQYPTIPPTAHDTRVLYRTAEYSTARYFAAQYSMETPQRRVLVLLLKY